MSPKQISDLQHVVILKPGENLLIQQARGYPIVDSLNATIDNAQSCTVQQWNLQQDGTATVGHVILNRFVRGVNISCVVDQWPLFGAFPIGTAINSELIVNFVDPPRPWTNTPGGGFLTTDSLDLRWGIGQTGGYPAGPPANPEVPDIVCGCHRQWPTIWRNFDRFWWQIGMHNPTGANGLITFWTFDFII